MNLRFAHQTESIGPGEQGFAAFSEPEAGWRAAHAQINLDKTRGLTVLQEIYKWAPPNENDTETYLTFVCRECKCDPDDALSSVSSYAIAGVMAAMEGYYAKSK